MATALSAPVGRRNRVMNVTNLAADQAKVINLLASIPASQGGMADDWSTTPLAGPNGSCPSFVADAIWNFQVFWRSRGTFHNIDGVVDPGGHTLAQLNNLADGGTGVRAFGAAAAGAGAAGGAGAALGGGGGASGGVGPVAQSTSVDAFTRGLQSVFAVPTDWSFTGSAGGGGAFLVIGAGGGTIDFSSPTGGSGSVGYGFIGASVGIDGGPDATFSYSTPSMWSAGVGKIRSRTSQPLTLDDFSGPMYVVNLTAISNLTLGNGVSMTVYMLGVPALIALGGLVAGPAILAMALVAAQNASAIGVMVGTSKGIDTSCTIAPGYARLL